MSTECNSAYLHSTLDPIRLRKAVKNLVRIIKRKVGVDNFDAIAYRGMSGAGVATTLGYILNKPLLMVRKKGVTSHTNRLVEGATKAKRLVVVDDCIATGETLAITVREIINKRKCEDNNEEKAEVVAVLLYNDCGSNYHFMTGDGETLSSKFRTIIYPCHTAKEENLDALVAMQNMKIYNFSLDNLGKNRYRTVVGSNLEVDDLK